MWYSKRLLIPLTLLLAVLTLSCGESDENGIPTRPGSAPDSSVSPRSIP